MGLAIETVRYGGGEHVGYFAMPERAARPLPAVLVVQEVWGVDAHIEDVARRFAKAGYAALAPDLYAKGGARPPPLARDRLAELQALVDEVSSAAFFDDTQRGAALSKLPADQRARVTETFAAAFRGGVGPMRLDAHVPSLLASAAFLREEHPPTRGQKVGSVGYCMGGGLSALLACHDPKLSVAAVYYGISPSAELVPKIQCPVFGFYGGRDKRIGDSVPAFAAAMTSAGKRFESRVYDDAQHAFFNDNRPSYDVRASRDAFARTLEIFRVELG